MKIPQGKQFRTPVSQILQALQRHMGSLLSCLCSTVPEYGNAAHDFALLESQSFRQICLLTVLCTPTRILSEQIMLKGKICKFNFKQQQKIHWERSCSFKASTLHAVSETLCPPDLALTQEPTGLFAGISKKLICLRT